MARGLEPAAAARTSATHPMTLSWVIPPGDDGRGGLGLHFCPGKEVTHPPLANSWQGAEEGRAEEGCVNRNPHAERWAVWNRW
jgi:hypothetical protein